MKLISLNVGLFEKNNDKLGEFLKANDADILALQEVTKCTEDSTNPEYISKVAMDRATPTLTESFFAPIWLLSRFEKADFHGQDHFVFDVGGKMEFGNYVRTKYPITKGQNVFVQNHFTYVTDWSKWPEEDYRAVQVVDLNIDNKPLRVLNYHGIWSKDKKGTEKTLQACKTIKHLASEVDYPAIICGDFNLFPDTDSITLFKPEFVNLLDAYDIQTTRPSSNELNHEQRNVVDYILVSKNIKVNTFEVVKAGVSDHLPLLLDFEYN